MTQTSDASRVFRPTSSAPKVDSEAGNRGHVPLIAQTPPSWPPQSLDREREQSGLPKIGRMILFIVCRILEKVGVLLDRWPEKAEMTGTRYFSMQLNCRQCVPDAYTRLGGVPETVGFCNVAYRDIFRQHPLD